jgi:hypothetical protein
MRLKEASLISSRHSFFRDQKFCCLYFFACDRVVRAWLVCFVLVQALRIPQLSQLSALRYVSSLRSALACSLSCIFFWLLHPSESALYGSRFAHCRLAVFYGFVPSALQTTFWILYCVCISFPCMDFIDMRGKLRAFLVKSALAFQYTQCHAPARRS